MDLSDALQLTHTDAPWWAGFAVVLLSGAAAVARRVVRPSARAQGERLGQLERVVEREQIRRKQVESVLTELGVDLPLWPPDGPALPRRRAADEPSGDPDDDRTTQLATQDFSRHHLNRRTTRHEAAR